MWRCDLGISPIGALGFELVACDVHIEGRAAQPTAAQTLLDGKLQVRVRAACCRLGLGRQVAGEG